MVSAEEAAAINAQYMAAKASGMPIPIVQNMSIPAGTVAPPTLSGNIANTPKTQLYNESVAYAAYYGGNPYTIYNAQVESIPVSQNFLNLQSAYNQQHYATVGSGGVTINSQYGITPANPMNSAAAIAAEVARTGGVVNPFVAATAIKEGYTGPISVPTRSGVMDLGISTVPIRDLSSGSMPTFGVNLGETTKVYVPYGNYAQEEISNVKLAMGYDTGELGIYQQPYGHSIYNLVGGGSRNALQSGMFTINAPETPYVVKQGDVGKFVLPSGEGLSRLGAETYGGFVSALDTRTIQSTGAQLSTYSNLFNLANYVNPQGPNIGKVAAPGADIPWSMGASAPAIQYMTEKGLTGIALNIPALGGTTVKSTTQVGAYVNEIVGAPKPFLSTLPSEVAKPSTGNWVMDSLTGSKTVDRSSQPGNFLAYAYGGLSMFENIVTLGAIDVPKSFGITKPSSTPITTTTLPSTITVSGGNETITNLLASIDAQRPFVDQYNPKAVAVFNANVEKYNIMSKENPVITTTKTNTLTTGTPGTFYKYGEWDIISEKGGEAFRNIVASIIGNKPYTTEQLAAYGETIANKPGLGGWTENLVYKAGEFLSTRPLDVLPNIAAGATFVIGGEVIGGMVVGLSEGTGLAAKGAQILTQPGTAGLWGAAARTVASYGLPAVLTAKGAYDVTEGFKVSPTSTEFARNIGGSIIPTAAFVGGAMGPSVGSYLSGGEPTSLGNFIDRQIRTPIGDEAILGSGGRIIKGTTPEEIAAIKSEDYEFGGAAGYMQDVKIASGNVGGYSIEQMQMAYRMRGAEIPVSKSYTIPEPTEMMYGKGRLQAGGTSGMELPGFEPASSISKMIESSSPGFRILEVDKTYGVANNKLLDLYGKGVLSPAELPGGVKISKLTEEPLGIPERISKTGRYFMDAKETSGGGGGSGGGVIGNVGSRGGVVTTSSGSLSQIGRMSSIGEERLGGGSGTESMIFQTGIDMTESMSNKFLAPDYAKRMQIYTEEPEYIWAGDIPGVNRPESPITKPVSPTEGELSGLGIFEISRASSTELSTRLQQSTISRTDIVQERITDKIASVLSVSVVTPVLAQFSINWQESATMQDTIQNTLSGQRQQPITTTLQDILTGQTPIQSSISRIEPIVTQEPRTDIIPRYDVIPRIEPTQIITPDTIIIPETTIIPRINPITPLTPLIPKGSGVTGGGGNFGDKKWRWFAFENRYNVGLGVDTKNMFGADMFTRSRKSSPHRVVSKNQYRNPLAQKRKK